MTRIRLILTVLVLFMAGSFAMAAENGSDTSRASCLLKITSDPAVMQLDEVIIEQLILSSGVAEQARVDILQLSQKNADGCYDILIVPLARQTTPNVRPTATARTSSSKRSGGLSMGMMPGGGMPVMPDSPENAGGGFGGGSFGGSGGMGGMGGYGYSGGAAKPRTPSRSTAMPAAFNADQQTLLFKLEVDLSNCGEPVAEEFLAALINNLEAVFDHAYRMRMEQLSQALEAAKEQQADALARINIAVGKTEDDLATEKQLETKVNLSKLTIDTSFKDAIDMIRKAVDPPLKLVVIWSDLSNNAFIHPDDPIGCSGDGMDDVPLRAGLERVLLAVSGGLVELTSSIKDGIITVATEDMGLNTRGFTNLGSGARLQKEVTISGIALDTLYSMTQDLQKDEYSRKMELSRMEARSKAIEKQIPKLQKSLQEQIHNDPVSLSIERLIDELEQHLPTIKTSYKAGTTDANAIAQMQEKISRSRIELARRKEEIGAIGGGGRIKDFTTDLVKLEMEIEESKAMQLAIYEQLRQIEKQTAKAEAINLKAAQTRQGNLELERIQQRINMIESEIATTAAPSTTVLGGK